MTRIKIDEKIHNEIMDLDSIDSQINNKSLNIENDLDNNNSSYNSLEDSFDSLINENDEGINRLKDDINKHEDINLFDNNNSNKVSKEKEDYKKPLHESLAKKHNINNSTFENFLLGNLYKKPKKRKFIYPKDEPDEDSDTQTNKNRSIGKKKKKGWLK